MRIVSLAFGAFLVSILPVHAQVTVEVVLDQEQFLRDESMSVKVRIANRSGQMLQLGTEPGWLTFLLENRDGSIVNKLADLPVGKEFSLESAMVASKNVDLMPFYDLSQPGGYTLVAQLKIKQWNEEFTSPPKNFEIVRGAKLWEQEVGVPAADGVPEVRKYALQQATYHKQFRLYARVTDLEETRIFKVLPIGTLVSFSHPEAQVDKQSNLHVLFQTGARSFAYCVLNPDGEIKVRQTHDYAQTRPVLKSADDGRIIVAGGVRRYANGDLPALPPPSKSTNDLKAPKS